MFQTTNQMSWDSKYMDIMNSYGNIWEYDMCVVITDYTTTGIFSVYTHNRWIFIKVIWHLLVVSRGNTARRNISEPVISNNILDLQKEPPKNKLPIGKVKNHLLQIQVTMCFNTSILKFGLILWGTCMTNLQMSISKNGVQGGAPPVISWFINHSKYRYKSHKP